MISFVTPKLPGTAMPSWRLAEGPSAVLAAPAGKAMTTGVAAARKRIAPSGAPAYAHVVCAAQHMSLVNEANSALLAVSADAVEPFGTQVQTQLSVDATRVEGRAGSPPRGEPV
ncbi:hypothetical protein [Cryptosporangium japonicum]|uniref:Uncharacterized protein n=1 Tax=Cryptosporangium japonicum TaxID=80872 RepID=A0ABN0VAI7_9ACTN